ncbi:hypothetical protein BHM03_00011472, partial [Ensete ventricosum]
VVSHSDYPLVKSIPLYACIPPYSELDSRVQFVGALLRYSTTEVEFQLNRIKKQCPDEAGNSVIRRYTLSARLAPLHSFRQVTTNLTLRGRTSYLNSASTTPLHSFGRGTADARQGTYVSRLAACRPAATLFWPRHATDALCYSLSARLTGRATLLTRYVIACRRPRHATDALCYSLSARRYTLSAFIWQARLAACRRASVDSAAVGLQLAVTFFPVGVSGEEYRIFMQHCLQWFDSLF